MDRTLALLQKRNFSDDQAIPWVAPVTPGMALLGYDRKYKHDARASGSVRRESTRLRVVLVLGLKFLPVERFRRTDASFRRRCFLICLAAESSVKFLRSWCVLTSRHATESTELRRLIWNLVIWNLENHGAEHAVLA